jgi:hypothetical protein
MADLPFWQQCVVSGVQGLGLGAAAFGGWLVFRHQERVKWDEQRAAEIRKLQLDAVLCLLDAVGRAHLNQVNACHQLEDLPEDASPDLRAVAEAGVLKAQKAFQDILPEIAGKLFLYGGAVGTMLQERMGAMMAATTSDDADAAFEAFQVDLARWIPPLKQLGGV